MTDETKSMAPTKHDPGGTRGERRETSSKMEQKFVELVIHDKVKKFLASKYGLKVTAINRKIMAPY
jgi:hypothetical protein